MPRQDSRGDTLGPVLRFPDRRCRASLLENPIRRLFMPAERALRPLRIREGETVVDLGAGAGYFSREILRQVGATGRVVAVDIDAANLAQTQTRAAGDGTAGRLEILHGSAASLTRIPGSSVDAGLVFLVLCCLNDKEGVLDEAWRILRPGGRLLVAHPLRRASRRPWVSPLRVTRERWQGLVGRHPWGITALSGGWPVRRWLLSKHAPPDS